MCLKIALPGIRLQFLDAQREPVRFGLDRQDHRLHHLALPQNFGGMLDALGPRKIRNMHQTVDAFFDLHKRAEVGHVADPAFHHRADAVAVFDRGPRIGFELFQPERDAAVLSMYVQNHGFNLVAGTDYLSRVFHTPRPGHLGDMDQTLDAGLEFHERTVVGDVDDAPDDALIDRIALSHAFPGIRCQLFHPQRNALARLIEFQNLDGNLVARMHDLRWMGHSPVGHVGYVKQAVDPAQIDECAVFGQVLDHARDYGPFFQMFQRYGLAFGGFLLDGQLA